MSLLGYSAKEISDVISGRITVFALDTALKMRGHGHNEKEISNYLDSIYKKNIARQRDSIVMERNPRNCSSSIVAGLPDFDILALRFSERYGIIPISSGLS